MTVTELTPEDFRRQEEFRRQIRLFLRASEDHCKQVNLGEKQYQCLLAMKAWPSAESPNITQLAQALQIEQHTAVELVDRMVSNGLIERFRQGHDRRSVYVRLTERADGILQFVAQKNRAHLAEHLGPFMDFLESIDK